MKKIILAFMAVSFLTLNAQAQEQNNTQDFKKWQARIRGIAVKPYESAKIGIIGGDVSLSQTHLFRNWTLLIFSQSILQPN